MRPEIGPEIGIVLSYQFGSPKVNKNKQHYYTPIQNRFFFVQIAISTAATHHTQCRQEPAGRPRTPVRVPSADAVRGSTSQLRVLVQSPPAQLLGRVDIVDFVSGFTYVRTWTGWRSLLRLCWPSFPACSVCSPVQRALTRMLRAGQHTCSELAGVAVPFVAPVSELALASSAQVAWY